MGLYEKILGLETPQVPVHAFQAAVNEVRAGKLTANQVRTAFGLTVAERDEAAALVALVTAGTLTAKEVDDVLLLANSGLFYNTVNTLKARLGVD